MGAKASKQVKVDDYNYEDEWVFGPSMRDHRSGCGVGMDKERGRMVVIGESAGMMPPQKGEEMFFFCLTCAIEARKPRLTCLDTVEVLDMETMQWSMGPDMDERRCGFGVGVHEERKEMIVVGGLDGEGYDRRVLRSVEVLDLEEMEWKTGPDMITRREGCGVGVDEERGKVIVVGGAKEFFCGNPDGQSLRSVEVLDIETLKWKKGPAMKKQRWACGVGVDKVRGKMVVVGGRRGGYKTTRSVEVLDLNTMKWSKGPKMNERGVVAPLLLMN
uniref:Uncharacterized protein n=1 Tax=Paramoeba aestuarina TaxID=180227 RepID=A0A7S4PIM5_9EUKA|mmetsp:Transcript_7052/g.10674  ORF Transcript_7052/g.10674 Transcript_7052/m.10674 type:complete len:273 (+) Transcript_7052:100-918(+)